MAFNVTALFQNRSRSKEWSQQDLAEFYRVENALIQGGLKVETARGLSDEGEPWFVFCHADNGDVVIHFARIEGEYVMASPAYTGAARGHDLRSLVQNLISRHSLVQAVPARSNILIHPGALLVALVGTAFFKLSDNAAAAEDSKIPSEAKKLAIAAGLLHHNEASNSPEEQSLGTYGSDAVLIAVATAFALVGEHDLAQIFLREGDQLFSVTTPETESHASGSAKTLQETATIPFSHTSNDLAEVSIKLDGAQLDQQPSQTSAVMKMTAEGGVHPAPEISSDNLASAQLALLAGPKDVATSSVFVSAQDANVLNLGFIPIARAGSTTSPTISNSDSPVLMTLNVKVISDILGSSSHLDLPSVCGQLPSAITNALSQALVVSENGTMASFLHDNQQSIATNFSFADLSQLNGANQRADANVQLTGNVNDSNVTLISNMNGQVLENLSSTEMAKILGAFLHQEPDIKVFVTQGSLVLVNSDVLQNTGAGAESITLNFTDGSSLSFVGQSAALHHIMDVI